jgi:hypothetical protein
VSSKFISAHLLLLHEKRLTMSDKGIQQNLVHARVADTAEFKTCRLPHIFKMNLKENSNHEWIQAYIVKTL